jgi:hypothetical protein
MTADTIAAVKGELIPVLLRAVAALRRAVPWLSEADAAFSLHAIELQLSGLWPVSNPSRAAREVLSRPEFAAMCVDAGRDFPRFIEVLLAGLRAGIRGRPRQDSPPLRPPAPGIDAPGVRRASRSGRLAVPEPSDGRDT